VTIEKIINGFLQFRRGGVAVAYRNLDEAEAERWLAAGPRSSRLPPG